MAILKMKKLRVIAMADQRRALLEGLMALGCVEISETQPPPGSDQALRSGTSQLVQTRTRLADVNTALDAIKRYGQVKDGFMIRRSGISREAFLSDYTVKR